MQVRDRQTQHSMIGTTLHNRYFIEAELGRGGMGTVYRAHDTLLDRKAAVKLLAASDLGSEGRDRLLREAQSAARLNHPNVVTVYDAGEEGDLPYIVLELIEGESLHERPPGNIDEILSVAMQLCAALEHAHTHGIIHRDLKPENVILAANGTAKLMDFGLARSRSATRLTQEGALVGTVFYLAPEQALGRELDGRADLYALGVILYELVTGRLPFTGDDPLAVISQHLHAAVVPPRNFRPDLPPALEAIILKLLAKDPADRFTSAQVTGEMLALAVRDLTSAEPLALPTAVGAEARLDQLAAGRLIGRRVELAKLRELWTQARQGHSHLLLISGEPGVGKTRLATELIVAAQVSGALTLRGGCYEYEATTPYLPFVEAVRAWVHAQDAATLRAYLDGTAPEMVKLAPEIESKLGTVAPNPPLAPTEERLRLFDSVARFFQKLAAGRGLLLFLDDLHWADESTLHLVHYLLRHLRDDPVLVLAAYREVELDRAHPLATALVEWNRERLATRLALSRLSQDETGDLLAALFQEDQISPEFLEAVYRETEGNPFFIEEVIKALIEQGAVYREACRWQRKEVEELAIPQSVKEAIGRRLDRLSLACVEALHTASALGKTFEYAELAAVAGGQEDQLLDALDEAAAAQLLRAESDASFAFTHDKIREVLYEELNPIRRRRLHQRVAESLEELYQGQTVDAHVQDLAYHFLESGDCEKGLSYALRAAQQAQHIYAPIEALSYYRQAADCAEALNLPDQLARIAEAIGDLHAWRGLFYEAVEAYQRALSLTAARDKRAALKTKVGMAYVQPGDQRGLEFLQAAQNELDPAAQADELANTLTMLGRYHHYRGQHHQAIAYFERARELAEPLDSALTLTYIYAYLAGAYQHLALYDESMGWARRCLALGERQNYPPALASGYEFLAEDLGLIGRWREAIDYARLDRQTGERVGSQDRVAWSTFCQAHALRGLGHLQEAADAARAGLEMAERQGENRLLIWLYGQLACIQADLGLDAEAAASSERAMQWADELGQVTLQCWTYYSRAYLHIQRGEWEPALEVYRRTVALYTPTESRLSALYIGAVAAEAGWGAGRLAEAEQRIIDYISLARETGALQHAGIAMRVQGQIYTAQGRWDEAGQAFDGAIARFEELGSRLELGRAFYYRSALRHAQGQVDAAGADAERARALFEACGAARDLEKAWQPSSRE